MGMKIYCEKCKKVFEAEKPEEGNQVECTHCSEKVNYPGSQTSPGAVIGGFVIERELSKGGMGEVYLARQISLDRPVALKVLQAKFLNDKEYVESFFREARAAGRINHPNVVQAYAVGEENGIFYFAMEYIRGKTMKEILKEKKVLGFEEAAKIVKEVASALECAWRDEKLVHQDIKPDNIMLDANGFAKLADLGLARVAGINDKEACEGDEVLGTPQYISPEQLTGVPTDVRSDIYSLGATFYQFVTGRFPYVADTAEEIAKMHVAGQLQPPKEVNPEIPDELNTIIMKMMARNIEDRYQTPAPLIKALDMYLMHAHSGKTAVPQLNFRLPKAPAAGGARVAAPFGGGAKPPLGGAKAPFGAKGPGSGGLPKATLPAAPKPAVPKAAPPAAPKPAVPKAAPATDVKPAAALQNSGQVAEQKAPAAEEVKKSAGKPADDDLVLKVTPKSEKKPAPPPEEPEAGAKGKDKGKKGKKEKEKSDEEKPGAAKIILGIVVGIVLLGITLGCLGGAFYFLASGNKLPEFMKPFGDKVVAFVKGKPVPPPLILPGDPFNEGKGQSAKTDDKTAKKADEPKEQPKEVEPPKLIVVTRPEYMAAIEDLLQMRRSSPNDYLGFLKASDEFFRKYPTPQTPEENMTLHSYLGIYNQIDERSRVAPAREAARQKFLAGLKERRDADEAAKKAIAAKLEEERQKKARQEAEARRLLEQKREQERAAKEAAKRRLEEIHPKLDPLFGTTAETFFTAIRNGNMAAFDKAISDLQLFVFPAGDSQEEMQLLNQVTAFGSELPSEAKKMRVFTEQLAQITPSKNSFTVETPSRDLITIVGLSPDGVKAIDGSGRPVAFDLTDKRLRAMVVNRLERRLKLEKPAFYLDMMTGNFSDETAKEAAGRNFWKTYYKPFMTAYFRKRLSNADAAERAELEKRYGKLPEFRAAK
ncbi:MAG: protein kinase [Lentisphaeria bacterium]|nr:protein kinase [Lentisphaeria bacterium]